MTFPESDLQKELRVSLRHLLVTTLLLLGIIAGSTVFTLQVASKGDERAKQADIKIVQSRVASVTTTCEQVNEQSEILAVLAYNSPAGQHPNADFRKFYAKLQSNDCDEMRDVLYRRLVVEKDFDTSIPYSPDPKGNGIPESLRLTPLP